MTSSLTAPTARTEIAPAERGHIPFSGLVGVEWAKAIDTRAARWLLALVAFSTVGMVMVPVLSPGRFDQTHASYLRVAALALTVPLPVVAILTFTAEWSQRSIITTFIQEPRRSRVLGAKLLVSALLSGAGAVFGGAVACLGIVLAAGSGRPVEADLSFGVVGGYVLFVLLNVLAAVALGVLLQSSAAAVATSFALPATVAALGTTSSTVSEWIDMSTTWNAVLGNEWGGHLPQIGFSVCFWVVTPLVAGFVRATRRDVC